MSYLKFSFVSIFGFLLIACQQQEPYVKLSGYTMGTTYSVTVKGSSLKSDELQAAIDSKLERINQLMSTYIDDSELSLFNSSHSSACQPLSPETYYVIQAAYKLSQDTQGKFDVTLAPLIEAWGFDKKETNNVIPSLDTITQLKNEIGYQKIILGQGCVAKQNPELSINLSAIAKGYAVDLIAELLEQNASQNYLVEIGGEVANKGINGKGKPWRIAIESATTESRSIQRVLQPKGLGVATSGSYRNYFEKDGKRFSHTIDATSGYPIDHKLASVTVLHKETMMADAIATAMMVMGPDESLTFANTHKLPIFMLVKADEGFKEVSSDAFQAYLH